MKAQSIDTTVTLDTNMETTTTICSAVKLACCFLLLMGTVSGKSVESNFGNSNLVKEDPRYDIQNIFLLPPGDDFQNNFRSIVLRGRHFDFSMHLAFIKSEGADDLDTHVRCSQNHNSIPIGHPSRIVMNKNSPDDAYFDVHPSNMPLIGDELFLCVTGETKNVNWDTLKNKLLWPPSSALKTNLGPFANDDKHINNIKNAQRSVKPIWRRKRSSYSEFTGNRRSRRNDDTRHRRNANESIELLGMTFEYDSGKKLVSYDTSGTPMILENTKVLMRLYGRFTNRTRFRFTKFDACDDSTNDQTPLELTLDASGTVGTLPVKLPDAGELYRVYICLGEENDDLSITWFRQGGEGKPWLTIQLYKKMLPMWVHVVSISCLLVLSGLFSGLNLGLMSLNKTDLKIIINTGTEQERDFAARIAPVRKRGNFLLCCLLFSNVLVNSTLTILVDDLTTGLIAILMSTMAIVIFGEIIPQAICSRHGLAVGARTIFITKFFMAITSPLAYPLSLVLDRILGEEIGSVYTRERLKELLKVTKDYHGLANEEVCIISGALEMKTKTVKDIMTKLENVFMLPCDAMLDFDTMAEVEYHGYTRIPVFDGEKNNVVALLNVKQLTLLDATDSIPLRAVIEYYHNQLFFVFENTHLDYMFRAFREGNRGHMAFIQKVNDEGPGDPYYETMGIVTMEDVLEELLQAEIMDESDVGKLQARGKNNHRRKYVPMASNKRSKACIELQKPLALAATQYLATSTDFLPYKMLNEIMLCCIAPFKREFVSVPIVQRLLRTNVFLIKISKFKYNQGSLIPFLYEAEKPTEYFTMILEGRVKVEVGREKLTYEAGPFTTFGCEFLLKEAEKEHAVNPETPSSDPIAVSHKKQFVPDYTVKILTDVQYLRLNYSSYKAARLATELERTYCDPEKAAANKNWEDEIEKVLQSGIDFDQSGQIAETQDKIIPRRMSTAVFVPENGDVPTEETKLL